METTAGRTTDAAAGLPRAAGIFQRTGAAQATGVSAEPENVTETCLPRRAMVSAPGQTSTRYPAVAASRPGPTPRSRQSLAARQGDHLQQDHMRSASWADRGTAAHN